MDLGAWLVAVSAAIALATALFLRRRVAPMVVAGILAVAGVGIGWGAMCLQDDPSGGEFVTAVVILAVLIPVHVRIVLGPFGPQR